nr:sodium-dependent bicarbonate transport family permease [Nodosilinea sp. LEGE 06152]
MSEFLSDFWTQWQSPTLGFLISGIVIATLGSKLQIPDAIYKFIVFLLLIKVGLTGGMATYNANLAEMLLSTLFAVVTGILIVRYTFAKLPDIRVVNAVATGGLSGAMSGFTMVAGITVLKWQGIEYENWAGALYSFMDIPALVTAIIIASIHTNKQKRDKYLKNEKYPKNEEYIGKQRVAAVGAPITQPLPAVAAGGYPIESGNGAGSYSSGLSGTPSNRVKIWPIVKESLQGSALLALLLGLVLGLLTQLESAYESFYATGFSLGGVVILAITACSSSDGLGPPKLRTGILSAHISFM